MLKNVQSLQRLAFLDTNVLHFLNLYFESVPPDRRYPTVDVIEQDDTDGDSRRVEEQSFKRTIEYIEGEKKRGEEALWTSVGKGLKAVNFLRGGGRGTPYRVEYARVSELELMEGRVRGAVVEQFAREGAPPRMWTRGIPEKVVESRVGREKRKEIWQGVGGLRQALGDMGIRVAVTRSGPSRDVMDLAWGVMKVVHLSVGDAIVYASTLRMRADCLVTGDEYLCSVVGRIKDAASGRGSVAYLEAAEEIRRRWVGAGAEEASFPYGHRITPIRVKSIERQSGRQK